MTESELQEIEARANAATEGPWILATSNSYRRFLSKDGTPVCEPTTQRDGHPDLFFRNGGQDGSDAQFIAHAREDVPALVAEVRRLRSMVEKYGAHRPAWAGQRACPAYYASGPCDCGLSEVL